MEEKEYRKPSTKLVLRLTCDGMEGMDAKQKREVMKELRGEFNGYCKMALNKNYEFDTSEAYWIIKLPDRPLCEGFSFDGEAFVVYCDSESRDVTKRLLPGQTITSEYDFYTESEKWEYRNMKSSKKPKPHHATLYISWPEWKINPITNEQLFEQLERQASHLRIDPSDDKPLDDSCDEIEVQVAEGLEVPETLRVYRPSAFPEAFIDDCHNDPQLLQGKKYLVVQPVRKHQVTYEHTSDYMDAAEAYGCDVDRETTVIERKAIGLKLEFDLM